MTTQSHPLQKPTHCNGWVSARSSGLLLHPTSLPGPFGVGDLGPMAFAWVEALAKAGQSWWQILPLGPTGQGDSPYSAFSAFAGNPLLVSPELLVRAGLVPATSLDGLTFSAERVDYGNVHKFKDWLLATAHQSFRGGGTSLHSAYDDFCHHSAAWLDDFALYMAIKKAHGNGDWRGWPAPLIRREPAALKSAASAHADAIDRERFRQFIFHQQWNSLKAHAAAHQVQLIGDAPIFVAADSADVWSRPELFLLGSDHKPKVVAGVPPDYFAKTGQLWGNPLYDWDALKKTDYAWWVARLKCTLAQVDVVRLDHFRGFEAAWHVQADAETAIEGEWVPGPGKDLFDVLRRELNGLPLVAEDLGLITKEVDALREEVGLPGMRVLQFAFGGDVTFKFLPHNFDPFTVVYTGTHDNDTTTGWYTTLGEKELAFLHAYLPEAKTDPAGALLRAAWASVADLALAPLQDVLGLGNEARMNVPGLADGNWSWRLKEEQLDRHRFDRLGEWTYYYNRRPANTSAASPAPHR